MIVRYVMLSIKEDMLIHMFQLVNKYMRIQSKSALLIKLAPPPADS